MAPAPRDSAKADLRIPRCREVGVTPEMLVAEAEQGCRTDYALPKAGRRALLPYALSSSAAAVAPFYGESVIRSDDCISRIAIVSVGPTFTHTGSRVVVLW